MDRYQRLKTRYAKEIDVDADEFFGMLTTWDSVKEWRSAPLAIARVQLFPGHQNGKTPCTRLVYPDKANLPDGTTPEMLPEFIPETLLHIDAVNRFILYCIEGEGPLGLRNYFATTEVDDLGNGRARVTCEGRMEIPVSLPAEPVRSLFETTYELGVIGGTLEAIEASKQSRS